MQLAWATDLHFNFAGDTGLKKFMESIPPPVDALLITGDIAESPTVIPCLEKMALLLERPIYFVLGNHDFYRGSLRETREAVARMARESMRLFYMPTAGVIRLTAATGLVGHDGWADARFGQFANSSVVLNDYMLIKELTQGVEPDAIDRNKLLKQLRFLGDEAAKHMAAVLPKAAAAFRRVIVMTHVPPFREACLTGNHVSGEDSLPLYTCKAVGDILLAAARQYPQCQFLVLCGHTHERSETQLFPNLRVVSGGAKYRTAVIQQVIEVE